MRQSSIGNMRLWLLLAGVAALIFVSAGLAGLLYLATEKSLLDAYITDLRIRADAIPHAPPSSPALEVPAPAEQATLPPSQSPSPRIRTIPDKTANPPAPSVPVPAGQIAPPPPEAPGKGGLAIVLAGGIAITLLAAVTIGGVLYLRRGKTPAASKPPVAFVSIACPDCGKKLKVKAHLTGKKVKCAQCGKAVLVADDGNP